MDSRSVRVRALLAATAVLGGAVFFGIEEAASPWGLEWGIIGLAGAYGIAGLLLLVRSLVAQLIARGALWVAVAPASLYTIETVAHGDTPDATALSTAIAAASALLLARPLLYTEHARKELAPAHCRPLFLTSAVWAAMFALPSLTVGTFFDHGQPRFFALGVLLLATAIGIVRLRTWSILSGVAAAILGVVLAVTDHYAPLLLTAAPGLLLVATLFLARAEARRSARRVRVASPEEAPNVRVESPHVALDDEEAEEAEEPELRAAHSKQ